MRAFLLRAVSAQRRVARRSDRRESIYVWGDADSTVGRIAGEATAEFVTGPYRFEVVEGAGHFLTDQVPDAVNRLLLEHLAAA